MINGVCYYCGSNICYDNDKETNGYWYCLVTRDNKRCLYFLCSNCYAKQTYRNPKYNAIIKAKSQNRKGLHRTKTSVTILSKLKTYLIEKILKLL